MASEHLAEQPGTLAGIDETSDAPRKLSFAEASNAVEQGPGVSTTFVEKFNRVSTKGSTHCASIELGPRVFGSTGNFTIPEGAWAVTYRTHAANAVMSTVFKNFIGFIILTNAVTIGLESSARIQDWQYALNVFYLIEQVFLAIYIVELVLYLFAFGTSCIFDWWVWFNSVLVMSGLVTNLILPMSATALPSNNPLMGLRLLRLLRLARTIRLIVGIRDLWLLVRSLMNSAGTMVYVIVLLSIVLYVFACVAVELITLSPNAIGSSANPDFQRVVNKHFATVETTMLTLVQFVSFDSIAAIYKPLIMMDPTPPLLTAYFTLAFVMIGVVLMNLITAVVVNSALDQATKDKEVMRLHEEKERKKLVTTLKKIFWRLDVDGSGTLTKDEVLQMNSSDRAKMLTEVGIFDPLELFAALDVDNKGVLEINAFCDSIWQVSHSQVPLEVKRTEKQVATLRHEMEEMKNCLLELRDSLLPSAEAESLVEPDLNGASSDCVLTNAAPAWAQELLLKIRQGVTLQVRHEVERIWSSPAGVPQHSSFVRQRCTSRETTTSESTVSTYLAPRSVSAQHALQFVSGPPVTADASVELQEILAQLSALSTKAVARAAADRQPAGSVHRGLETPEQTWCDLPSVQTGVLVAGVGTPSRESTGGCSMPPDDEAIPRYIPRGQSLKSTYGGVRGSQAEVAVVANPSFDTPEVLVSRALFSA